MHTLKMGILNVTPDSFSDGGKYCDVESALKHADLMIGRGVDIIDIGGESTRPGAERIDEKDEISRVIPTLKAVKKKYPNILISIDTYKSTVAEEALTNGANIINDVSGLTMDSKIATVAAKNNCPIIIMHNRGIPATKPKASNTKFLLTEIKEWLAKQTDYALAQGVRKENMIIDPGIGFGKTPEEDLHIVNNIDSLKDLGFKILIGASKKSFIKKMFKDEDCALAQEKIENTIAKSNPYIIRKHY